VLPGLGAEYAIESGFHPITGIIMPVLNNERAGKLSVGDLLTTTKEILDVGGTTIVTQVYRVVYMSGLNAYLELISHSSPTIYTTFNSAVIHKTNEITVYIYAGYRKGVQSGLPVLEKYASFKINSDTDNLYTFRIDGYLVNYIGEVLPPTITGVDSSLFLHYYITVVDNGSLIEQPIGEIKAASNGCVENLNASRYVTNFKQLNDVVYKNKLSHFFFSRINDDVVINTILDSEYVPPVPPDPGGGGTVNVKRADGTLISSVTAPADYTVANTNAKLTDTAGAVLSTTAIKAAGPDQDIIAPDGEAQLVNTLDASIGDVAIKAGETKEVVVPNTEITVKNSLGLSIENVEVPSCQPSEIVVDDSTVVIKNSLDEELSIVTVAASASVEEIIPDATVNIKDSAGVMIEAKDVAATKTVDANVPDSTITLNGDAWTNVKANGSKDIALIDELDNPITPLLADDTEIKVNTNYGLMAYIIGDN
jgi:hypothetical protein